MSSSDECCGRGQQSHGSVYPCSKVGTLHEKEESIKAFVRNVLCPGLLRLMEGLCRYIKVQDYPIRTSRDATLFLRQTITCYVNCLKDDQDLMDKYKLLCLHTLTELKDVNAPASFEYVPL